MFIHSDKATYIEIPSNDSEICNFMTPWKMIKNAIKRFIKFFLHEINENMQRKLEWNVKYIRQDGVTYVELKNVYEGHSMFWSFWYWKR